MNLRTPRWVDFHCHLDLYREHRALVRECDLREIATLAVTTTPKAYPRNVEIAAGSRFVMVGLGLHPQLVAERSSELRLFEKYLETTQYVGEIGLDAGSKFYSSFGEQQRVFSRILRACDEQGGKILSIHSVRSVSKVLAHLESDLRRNNTVPVLHWFTGTKSEARRASEFGCFFSVNIEMLRSPKAQPMVQSLSVDRLLTESDGPFVLLDREPSRPTDMPDAVATLAALRGIDPAEMAAQIAANFRVLDTGRRL